MVNRKKKILCFIDSLGAGGAQRQIVGLANLLSENGFNVQMLVYHDVNFFQGSLSDKIKLYILPESNNLKRIFNAYLYIKHEKPDWLISFLESPSIISCIVKFLYPKFKLIVSERNTTQHIGIRERLRFNLFRVANYVVPNAYSQEKFIKDNFQFLQKKTTTIANFVDLNHFSYIKRQRHSIPQIVIAATIWRPKNVLNFIKAVKILTDQNIRLSIKWFGHTENVADGSCEYYQKCCKLIEELGVGDCIQLLEKTRKIKEEYHRADYFCLPSFYEGTPNVICEAIATGLPVICSNVCDNSLYVQEGINGFLFNPEDIYDIADKIQQAVRLSDSEWETYCRNSRAIAEQKLSLERFIFQYESLVEFDN